MKNNCKHLFFSIVIIFFFSVTLAHPASLGDVNNDSIIDIVDALLIAQYYVGLNPQNFDASVSDVNCDTATDIVDALLVAQYYVSLISGFPCSRVNFIQTDGTLLKKPDNSPFLIKGIAFGNHVWSNPSSSSGFTHHSAEDYARVKNFGFNSIRFYINYGLFEDDADPYVYKQAGFDWIDQNITWAQAGGIYLILNMHYPQGGFQSNGDGDALWNDRDNQLRLIALWEEIARRYKDEPVIIGYGLVNEPLPLEGVNQWAVLAQEIIDAIRTEDQYHLIFVERANWSKTGFTQEELENNCFPVGLNDPGPAWDIVYEYHMYSPIEFTHQNASWTPYAGTFAHYPDPSRIEANNMNWEWFSSDNPQGQTGTTGWATLEGVPYTADDPVYKIGLPAVQGQGLGADGSIYIDDIVVEEYDQNGMFIQTLLDTSVDSAGEWTFWSADDSGSYGLATGISGASNNACMQISGTTDDAVINNTFKFVITRGNQYKITGRYRSENVASNAIIRFRVDFYSCTGDVHVWNKEFLQSLVDSYIDFAAANNAPVYLGEFGTIIYSFQENRGGITWVTDLLDILTTGNVNYNYHTYHETMFGLYTNSDSSLPDPEAINQPLADLFLSLQE